MSNPSALAELIERVEGGEGPDRELEELICVAVSYAGRNSTGALNIRLDDDWAGDLLYEVEKDGALIECCNPIPFLTASLDAVVSLIEATLPGMSWEVRRSGFGTPSQAMIWDPMKSPPVSTLSRVVAPSPARALLAATLRATCHGR